MVTGLDGFSIDVPVLPGGGDIVTAGGRSLNRLSGGAQHSTSTKLIEDDNQR
jgi:hypothetical protein